MRIRYIEMIKSHEKEERFMQNAKRCGCSFQQNASCYAGERIRVNAGSACGCDRCSVQERRCQNECGQRTRSCRPCAPRPTQPRCGCDCRHEQRHDCGKCAPRRSCGNDPYGYANFNPYGYDDGCDWDWYDDFDCCDYPYCNPYRRRCSCEAQNDTCAEKEHDHCEK